MAMEEFTISQNIRERFPNYNEYLDRLQDYINDQEVKLTEINDNLAEEYFNKFQ